MILFYKLYKYIYFLLTTPSITPLIFSLYISIIFLQPLIYFSSSILATIYTHIHQQPQQTLIQQTQYYQRINLISIPQQLIHNRTQHQKNPI